ncbi:MAG: Rpp14/Pop5 family protein [Candidatus Heimdallarchaeaceae archaeon]
MAEMVVITRDRYVVFQVLSAADLPTLPSIKAKIWDEYQKIFGISGTTGAGLFFDNYKDEEGTGIIRCDHRALSNLMAILSRVTEINDKDIILIALYTTGLVNKAKSYLKELGK